MLQPTGDALASGEAIITRELMATGEAELHIFQTMRNGRIVVSQDSCFACWSFKARIQSCFNIFVASELERK